MNQSVLIIADFEPNNADIYQQIDYEYFDIRKLFDESGGKATEKQYLLIHEDAKGVFKRLKTQVRVIRAAGGLVKNGRGDYLFIYRLSKWDLPKGKLDDGEKTKIAAVREVEEECGIKVHYQGPLIHKSYHLYTIKGELVIKKTNWYEMGVNGTPKLVPQKEEDITKAIWLSSDRLDMIRKNTYPLVLDLLEWMENPRIFAMSKPV